MTDHNSSTSPGRIDVYTRSLSARLKAIVKDICSKKILSALIFITVITVGVYFGLRMSFIAAIFLYVLVFGWSARIFLLFCIGQFVFLALFVLAGFNDRAQQMALSVHGTLILAVILLLVENLRKNSDV